jgi:hypothetical protein
MIDDSASVIKACPPTCLTIHQEHAGCPRIPVALPLPPLPAAPTPPPPTHTSCQVLMMRSGRSGGVSWRGACCASWAMEAITKFTLL